MSKRRMKREKIIVSLNDMINHLGPRHFNYVPLYIFNGRDGRKERERDRKRMKEKEEK